MLTTVGGGVVEPQGRPPPIPPPISTKHGSDVGRFVSSELTAASEGLGVGASDVGSSVVGSALGLVRETGLGVPMISVSTVVGGPQVDGEVGLDLPLFPLPLPLPDGTISLVMISS